MSRPTSAPSPCWPSTGCGSRDISRRIMSRRRLQDYLLNLLRHDATPEAYSKGMTATVRAVALAALAESGKVKPADVERYRGHLPAMNLFGRSFYLRALLLTGAAEGAAAGGAGRHSRPCQRGSGGMVFTESLDSDFQILLSSPVRDNAAIMINLLAWLAANPADRSVGEMPIRLMRSLSLSRKGRDHWPNTQENLFVVKALVDYARLYEDQAPEMTVEARLDENPFGRGRFASFTEPPLLLERPLQAGDAGRKARLNLEKEGEGRLYYAARLAYSPAELPDAAVNAGIEVHREYSVKRAGQMAAAAGADGAAGRARWCGSISMSRCRRSATLSFSTIRSPAVSSRSTGIWRHRHRAMPVGGEDRASGRRILSARFADWQEDGLGRGVLSPGTAPRRGAFLLGASGGRPLSPELYGPGHCPRRISDPARTCRGDVCPGCLRQRHAGAAEDRGGAASGVEEIESGRRQIGMGVERGGRARRTGISSATPTKRRC